MILVGSEHGGIDITYIIDRTKLPSGRDLKWLREQACKNVDKRTQFFDDGQENVFDKKFMPDRYENQGTTDFFSSDVLLVKRADYIPHERDWQFEPKQDERIVLFLRVSEYR